MSIYTYWGPPDLEVTPIKKVKVNRFNDGDLVMVLIPEPNVTNYGFHKYNYQLGIVKKFHPDPDFSDKYSTYSVIMDSKEGVYEELQHVVKMYHDHIILIERKAFS